MKIKLDKDEWYLYSRINDPNAGYGIEVDVPASTVKRWDRAHDLFMEVQREINIVVGQLAKKSKKERKK